jgi:SAM-dependent methyltransferase
MSAQTDTDHARAAYETAAPVYDEFTSHHRYDEWTAAIERLARQAGLRGRRLLDVGCGTGKSFLPFLERGYDVVACDISPAMVSLASAKAAGRARVEVHDMRRLPRLGEFDLVSCLDDAVNYLHTGAEMESAMRGFAANLAPDGILVFDTNTLLTYRTFYASLSVMQSEGQVLVWDGRAPADLPAGGLAEARLEALQVNEGGTWERTISVHRQRHHPEPAVRAALRSAGLEVAAVHGMHLEGTVTEGVTELADTKAMYVARAQAHSPGTGVRATGTVRSSA